MHHRLRQILRRKLALSLAPITLLAASCGWSLAAHAQQARPNVLIILADDLGWSDLGYFGSEIRTPNLDALAERGLAMTQFYVAPTCSPTRAMLMTGLDNHRAGVGTMAGIQAENQREAIGYGAQLHDGVITVAETLQSSGYHTLMSGKWHLALDEAQRPHRRGFKRSFTMLQGGASHFADRAELHPQLPPDYLEDGAPVSLPQDFYSSTFYADKLIEYLAERPAEQPFFAYLAFTAPHDPLQVPDDWLTRYRGHYADGPEAIRAQRVARLRSKGLFPDSALLPQPLQFPTWLPMHQPPWEARSPEQQARDARPMEIYAAMVELMDQEIGRVLSWLEAEEQLDNTYVLFFSDNGASGATPLFYPHATRDWFLGERDHRPENLGRPGSHVFVGGEWASASNAPLKQFKTSVAEGGIRSPLLVAGPGIGVRGFVTQPAQVVDLVPTVYAWAGIDANAHPAYADKPKPTGQSLHDFWLNGATLPEREIGVELFGNSAIRKGRFKATRILAPLGSGEWALFDLLKDPGEVHDVSAEHPETLSELIAAYDSYASANGVIPPQPRSVPYIGNLYVGECDWWCELRISVAAFFAGVR